MSASHVLKSYHENINKRSLQDNYFSIPNEFGRGNIESRSLKNGVTITKWQMKYLSDMMVYGKQNPYFLNINLCLNEKVEWEDSSGKERILSKGETYMDKFAGDDETIVYKKDHDYSFINVKIPATLFYALLNEYFEESRKRLIEKMILDKRKFKIEMNILKIINDIYDCSLGKSYQDLYVDGKLQELLALYFNAFLEEDDRLKSISKSDIKAILAVKQIIEENIVDTPALGELAHLVNLNTSKLCKLFKEIYGTTLHTYIINKRMAYAAELLGEEGASVTSVANALGYSNISHFSSSFRKKNFILPSEFLKLK